MYQRLKDTISYYQSIIEESPDKTDLSRHRENLLIQIQFFQHERLIHLIVTVLFALLTVGTLFVCLFYPHPILFTLLALFLILLIPYIIHYYHLENGVQKLYTYYDKMI